MRNSIIIIALFCFPGILQPQCSCNPDNGQNSEKPFYTFSFSETKHKLILCGFFEKADNRFIYASEFHVVNCYKNDTIAFFDALRACRIDTEDKISLTVIELKNLPFGKRGEWKRYEYLSIRFKEGPGGTITIDTSFVLPVQKLSDAGRKSIYKKYEKVKQNGLKLPEELCYQILQIALNGDAKAGSILFKMKNELKLDGEAAEIHSDAIKIFNSYLRFNR